MSEDADYLYALQMQRQLNGEDGDSDIEEIDFKYSIAKPKSKQSNPHSNLDEDFLNRMDNLVHPSWETLDPTPDIYALFGAFDTKFFQGRLKCVTVEWSKRMYSCAGICYSRSNRFGLDVTIRLSEPLLKLRPRKDLVETMLHEMIHAYCFVLKIREGNGGHGPYFKKIMHGINKVAGTNITVYHTFHDEVDLYKQHWWRCNGICQNRAPFFGYVKRTNNRAPGPNDQWWAAHMQSCGGTFMKIKGPEKRTKDKSVKILEKEKSQGNVSDLRKYFTPQNSLSTTRPLKSDSTNNKYSEKNSTVAKKNGFQGPMASNGSGTLLLNPNIKRPSLLPTGNTRTGSSIATLFPPSSYPGLSSNPFDTNKSSKARVVPPVGNLVNVRSLNDLKSPPISSINQGVKFGPVISNNKRLSDSEEMGRGYSFSSGGSTRDEAAVALPKEVDRNHLRQLWSNKFSGCNKNSPDDDKETTKDERLLEGDTKRRRTSISNFVADEVQHSSVESGTGASAEAKTHADRNAWVVVDDDVMLQERPEEIIALSSSDDETDEPKDADSVDRLIRSKNHKLTAGERQTIIKKEIIDEAVDADLTDDDIVLIDDDYNDDEDLLSDSVAIELADTSLIDDLFGEDTLLKEFKKENDVVPSGSRYIPNPLDDIITCPICQGKMKRSSFADHLDGCTGITIKIVPPKAALKKLSTISKQLKPSRKSGLSRQSAKEILRNAGYSELDLLNITSGSSADDEEEFLNTTTLNGSQQIPATITTVDLNSSVECDESSRRYRQRNIFKTTRQCPVCGQEVEEDDMNVHLDDCLKARKKEKIGLNTT